MAALFTVLSFLARFPLTNSRAIRLSGVVLGARGGDPSARSGIEQRPTVREARNAVDDLLAEHADAVYRYALRLCRDASQAEDLLQETMLRGWKQRGVLREPAAARVWLLRIATNLHRDWRRGTRDATPLVAEVTSPERGGGVEGRLEQKECVAMALAALDELPQRQRQVMHLATIEQLPQETIGELLGISVEAVKASLSAARKAMRERLKDIYDEMRGARRD